MAPTNPQARRLRLARPLGEDSASPDPMATGFASPGLWRRAPPRLTPRPRAPSRPTLGFAPRLARPQGRELRLIRHLGLHSASLDPEATGSASPGLWGRAPPHPIPRPWAPPRENPRLRTPSRPTETHTAANHSRSKCMGLGQSSDIREETGMP